MKQKHPLEYVAEEIRAQESPYQELAENRMILTNFPKDKAITQAYVTDLI